MAQQVIKVVLSSGKVVILREMQVSDTEKALQMAVQRSGDNKFCVAVATQAEILKLLLMKIDGQTIAHLQKEDLNSLFKVSEYNELMKVIDKVSGGGEEGKSKVELVLESSDSQSQPGA